MIENKSLEIFLLLESGRYICARGGHEGGMLHWWRQRYLRSYHLTRNYTVIATSACVLVTAELASAVVTDGNENPWVNSGPGSLDLHVT